MHKYLLVLLLTLALSLDRINEDTMTDITVTEFTSSDYPRHPIRYGRVGEGKIFTFLDRGDSDTYNVMVLGVDDKYLARNACSLGTQPYSKDGQTAVLHNQTNKEVYLYQTVLSGLEWKVLAASFNGVDFGCGGTGTKSFLNAAVPSERLYNFGVVGSLTHTYVTYHDGTTFTIDKYDRYLTTKDASATLTSATGCVFQGDNLDSHTVMNLGENGTTGTVLCMYQYCAATTNYALYCGVFDPDFVGFSTDQTVNLKLIHSTTTPKQVLIAAYGASRDAPLVLVQKDNDNWDLYSAPANVGSAFTSMNVDILTSVPFLNYFVTSKKDPSNVYSMVPGGSTYWHKTTSSGNLITPNSWTFPNTALRLYEDIDSTQHPRMATSFSINIDIAVPKIHHGYTVRLYALIGQKQTFNGLQSYCEESNGNCVLFSGNQLDQTNLFVLDNKTLNESSSWQVWGERGIEDGTVPCNSAVERYIMVGSVKVCYTACPSFLPAEYPLSANDIQCTNGCGIGSPPSDPYQNSGACVASCPGLMTPTSGAFTANEKGICGPCAANHFSLAENGVVYSDSSPKKYCLAECPSTHPIGVEDSDKSCTNSCDPTVATATFDVSFNIIYFDDATAKISCVQNCPPLKPYGLKQAGQIGNCYADCPSSHPIIVDSTGKRCTDSCDSTVATAEFEANLALTYLHDSSGKTYCLEICPSDKNYLNRPTGETGMLVFNSNMKGTCKNSCPPAEPFGFEDLNMFFCVTACTAPKALYLNSTKECVSSCTSDEPDMHPDGYCYKDCLLFLGECVDECPEAYPFVLNHECVLTCNPGQFVENNNFDSIGGTCLNTCDNYVLSHYNSIHNQTLEYCLSDCPIQYKIAELSLSDKKCVFDCSEVAPLVYLGERKCTSNCVSAGYSYVDANKNCLTDCSFFIDQDILCVKHCPSSRPVSFEGKCMSSCPSSSPFLEHYLYCTDECPESIYDQFCVNSCDEEELRYYLASLHKSFEERPFTLSTGMCSTDCTEPDYPFKNPTSGQCLRECPSDMAFVDEENLCRATCEGSMFPFSERSVKKCLRLCPDDYPFFQDGSFVCLNKCPRSFPIVLKQRYLGDLPVLPHEQRYNICSDTCSKEAPVMIETTAGTVCLDVCPQFHTEISGKCVLYCSPLFGLIPNETNDSCYSCQTDFSQFYFAGKCLEFCPSGHVGNVLGVCLPCMDLHLWTDPEGICVSEAECMKYDDIDYNYKTCSNCEGDNKYVVVVEGNQPQCLKTNCSSGIVLTVNQTKYCYICGENRFYHDKACWTSCPVGFTNDFRDFTCKGTCSGDCGALCCVNSDVCTVIEGKTVCQCKKGYFGLDCGIEQKDATNVSTSILSYLKYKFEEGNVTEQDVQSITQYYFLADAPSQRLLREEEETLLKNLENYIYSNYIKYAFQPHILRGIDAYLLIAFLKGKREENFELLGEMNRFLLQITSEIQEFLVKFNTVVDFEVLNEGKYKGTSFDFTFGPDAAEIEGIELQNCLKSIEDSLETTRVSYRVLKVNKDILPYFPFPEGNLFFEPNVYLELYAAKKVLNTAVLCSKSDFDFKFIPVLDSNTIERVMNFAEKGYNLFDSAGSFFVDRCVKFAENSQDVSLNARNQHYYLDPAIVCNETPLNICQVDEFDSFNNPICSCKGIGNKSKNSQKDQYLGYPSSNYALLFCKNVFNNSYLPTNTGFLVIFFPFALLFVLAIYHVFTTDTAIMSVYRFKYVRNDMLLFDPSRMVAEVYFRECACLHGNVLRIKRKLRLLRLNQIKDSSSSKDAIKALPTLRDIENLPFEDQIRLDNRSLLSYTADMFIEHHSLFYTFFTPSLVDPKYYRILLFITQLNLQTTFNAFFIDDSDLDSFNSTENPDIIFFLTNESLKIFWAVLTSKLLSTFLLVFYRVSNTSKRKFMRRMLSISPEYLRMAFNKYMLDQRLFTLLFTLIVLFYNLTCLYFISIYAEIFENSMEIWINGIIIGWIADFLLFESLIPGLFVFSRFVFIKTGRHTWIHVLAVKLCYIRNLSADI